MRAADGVFSVRRDRERRGRRAEIQRRYAPHRIMGLFIVCLDDCYNAITNEKILVALCVLCSCNVSAQAQH